MSATDELRRLLDERGVEWDYGITGATTTRFSVGGIDLTFTPMRDGLVCSTILTPEQAIAATLGPCNDSCSCTNGERTNLAVTLGDADATPTRQGDAVEVVRCRDCKHCREHNMRAYGGDCGELLCHHFSMSSGAGWPVEPDGFCKWGERKEVDG